MSVSNAGSVASSGAVSVSAALASGLTATAISGPSWTCTLNSLSCTRSDSLTSGGTYPTITIKVNTGGNLTGSITTTVSVSGGDDQNLTNNTATDTTKVWLSTTVSLNSSPNPAQLGQTIALVATVAPSIATGKVTFYDSTNVVGVATLSGGQAGFNTLFLPEGTRLLSAEYGGDSTYGPSVSATRSQTVIEVPTNGNQGVASYKADAGTYVATGDFNSMAKPTL